MISVVIPCYNAEKTLRRAVESILSQTDSGWQMVLVDDGSTDSTPLICDDYSDSDNRIKTVHQRNKGLMGAWKHGVEESDGEYVVFCDSDDYVDKTLIEKINEVIATRSPDIILYGLTFEYTSGKITRSYNRIKPGYYDRNMITDQVLPNLLSDGGMQSELIMKSRCSKAFCKKVLMSVLPILNEEVSFGEDQLTMFSTVLSAGSLFCMNLYCPYHYVRTSESMIGRFDPGLFDKLDILYRSMEDIAGILSYDHMDQILAGRLSNTLLYVKKYISRSSDGYRTVAAKLKTIRESEPFKRCIETCSVSGYRLPSRLFAYMFIKEHYIMLYSITRAIGLISRSEV